jgi:hypothetical protein
MSTPTFSAQDASAFFTSFQQQLLACRSKLDAIDADAIARTSGFLERSPRKIPMPKFLKGLLAVAPEAYLTLEHIANVIGLAAHTSYTKQSLSERLSAPIEPFLAQVITALFGQLAHSLPTSQALEPFNRVLVQDSTSQTLPKHLAKLFPGAGNQHGQDYATLKIQWISDLKNSAVEHVSLSGFTRNDQAAAPDILEVARPGDLVLRDLGYFTTTVLAQLVDRHIFFLSRYRHGVNPHDPKTGKPLNLKALLKHSGSLDQDVLLGPEPVAVRLVALPVPEEVANLRRHKAKISAQQRHRSPPGAEHLFLMGWNLYLTNVPAAIWPPKTLAVVYRLRWRIEIVFKTWKSHLGLRQLNCRTPVLLQLSVLTKLLFCAIVCQVSDLLEINCAPGQHISLLRLGHILGQCACWFSATVLGISVAQWLRFCLARHAFYERRRDRTNYYQLLSGAGDS